MKQLIGPLVSTTGINQSNLALVSENLATLELASSDIAYNNLLVTAPNMTTISISNVKANEEVDWRDSFPNLFNLRSITLDVQNEKRAVANFAGAFPGCRDLESIVLKFSNAFIEGIAPDSPNLRSIEMVGSGAKSIRGNLANFFPTVGRFDSFNVRGVHLLPDNQGNDVTEADYAEWIQWVAAHCNVNQFNQQTLWYGDYTGGKFNVNIGDRNISNFSENSFRLQVILKYSPLREFNIDNVITENGSTTNTAVKTGIYPFGFVSTNLLDITINFDDSISSFGNIPNANFNFKGFSNLRNLKAEGIGWALSNDKDNAVTRAGDEAVHNVMNVVGGWFPETIERIVLENFSFQGGSEACYNLPNNFFDNLPNLVSIDTFGYQNTQKRARISNANLLASTKLDMENIENVLKLEFYENCKLNLASMTTVNNSRLNMILNLDMANSILPNIGDIYMNNTTFSEVNRIASALGNGSIVGINGVLVNYTTVNSNQEMIVDLPNLKSLQGIMISSTNRRSSNYGFTIRINGDISFLNLSDLISDYPQAANTRNNILVKLYIDDFLLGNFIEPNLANAFALTGLNTRVNANIVSANGAFANILPHTNYNLFYRTFYNQRNMSGNVYNIMPNWVDLNNEVPGGLELQTFRNCNNLIGFNNIHSSWK
jgi:hypothetical protein